MKWWTVGLALLTGIALTIAACGGDNTTTSKRGKQGASVVRKEVPAEYKDLKPPDGMDLKDVDVIDAGKKSFLGPTLGNCISCHGEGGKGNGPLAGTLDPKPQDLTDPALQDEVSDQYIFWRVKTAGEGAPEGLLSAMTGFPGATDKQIWEVVAYVRSLKGK
jgi:mono/diheme cytochrome c family protein